MISIEYFTLVFRFVITVCKRNFSTNYFVDKVILELFPQYLWHSMYKRINGEYVLWKLEWQPLIRKNVTTSISDQYLMFFFFIFLTSQILPIFEDESFFSIAAVQNFESRLLQNLFQLCPRVVASMKVRYILCDILKNDRWRIVINKKKYVIRGMAKFQDFY